MDLPPSLAAARRHPAVAAAVLAVAGVQAWAGIRDGKPGKAAAYLGTMLLAVLLADLLARGGARPEPAPVRRPGRETAVALAAVLAGLLFLVLNFRSRIPGGETAGLVRLATVVGVLAFSFPTALAAWLLWIGYRPRTLGFRVRGLAGGALALVLTASAALVADPDRVTLWRALDEMGGWTALASAGAGAALSEEFLRFVLQTRIGARFGNPAAGWLAASLLWAALHVPVFAFQAGGRESFDVAAGALGAVRIVPLGLLWGYLTHRTGSAWPAMLAHGLNFWGLQNP